MKYVAKYIPHQQKTREHFAYFKIQRIVENTRNVKRYILNKLEIYVNYFS